MSVPRRDRKGFTLIELLVVIVIIAFISENNPAGPPNTAGSMYQNLANRSDGQVIGEY